MRPKESNKTMNRKMMIKKMMKRRTSNRKMRTKKMRKTKQINKIRKMRTKIRQTMGRMITMS